MRSLVRKVALVLLLFAIAMPRTAHARERRITLVGVDPILVNAITVALTPWELKVVTRPGPAPEHDLHAAAARALEIARSSDAGAVLWIVPTPREPPSVWVYDVETQQLVVRPLGASPPFDDASAAAVALSVKTLLRTSTVAPPSERALPPAVPAPAPEPAKPLPEPPVLPRQHVIWLEATGGARLLTGASDSLEARGGIGASLWPRVFDRHLGFSLGGRLGTGVRVDGRSFTGRASDVAVSSAGRLRTSIAGPFATELGVGASLHVASIDGTLIPSNVHASATRVNASVDAALLLDLALGARTTLGALFETSFLLRYQDYSVATVPVLRLPPVGLDLGARLSVALD